MVGGRGGKVVVGATVVVGAAVVEGGAVVVGAAVVEGGAVVVGAAVVEGGAVVDAVVCVALLLVLSEPQETPTNKKLRRTKYLLIFLP
jgi:hypothetical protein